MSMASDDRTMVAEFGRPSVEVSLSSGRRFGEVLRLDEIILGRAKDSDLVIEDAGVSRRHARIRHAQGQWVIEDMQSANGVFVNKSKTSQAVLAHGDVVTLGGAELSFFLPDQPQAVVEDRTVMKKNIAGRKEKRAFSKNNEAAKPSGKGRFAAVFRGLGIAIFLVLVISFWFGRKSETETVPAPEPTALESGPAPSAHVPDVTMPLEMQVEELPADAPRAVPGSVDEEARILAARYAEAGQIYYDSGRYPDAVAQWSHSLSLDPTNEVISVKLESTRKELLERADEAYRTGLRNFQFLNYDEAIRNWNYVLHLIPDPEHPLHQNAARNMEQARTQMQR